MIQENHSCVITQEPREKDYIAGLNSPLPYVENVSDGNWTPFLPDFDLQKENGLETDACITFSAVQSVEVQINWLLKNNLLSQYHIDGLKSLDFLTDGTFHASERYLAVLDGTTENGNTMPAPWDTMRTYGLIPYDDMPFSADITTWGEYYTQPTPEQIAKGKQFLDLFALNYEYVWANGNLTCPIPYLLKHLKQAPLCIATPVCWPWNQVEVSVCTLTAPQHSTMVYNEDQLTHILDHYVPFLKELPQGYFIPYAVKGIVSIVPPPQPPSVPTTVAPTQANVNILTQIVSLYQKILSLLKVGK